MKLIKLDIDHDGKTYTLWKQGADPQARVMDLDGARWLGFARPRKIRDLIDSHRADLEALGPILTTTAENPNDYTQRPTVGRPPSRAQSAVTNYLTREHLMWLAAKSETPMAHHVLRAMIAVFTRAMDGRLLSDDEIDREVERRVSRRLDQQRTEEAGRAVIGKGLASGVLKRIQTIAALRLAVQPHRAYASLRAKEEQQLRHALALDSDLPWHLFPLLGYAALEQELYRRERDARKDADALPQYPGQGRWGW